MDDRKHAGSVYRAGSGGAPVSDGRGGGGGSGQHYMAGGGRSGGRDSRRPRERDGRDQRMRSNRGRVSESKNRVAVDLNRKVCPSCLNLSYHRL